MLTFTIAVSFEIKAGNISKEKLKAIKDNDEYTSVIFTSKILNDNNQFYLREFDSRYFINETSTYKFFKFIEIYVRTRSFDEKIYRENMNYATNTYNISRENKIKYYTKILNGEYWKYSDFDFDILWQQVIDEIKFGNVDFKEHVKLFAIFKYLIDTGLIKYPLSELKHTFELGMQISATKNISELFDSEIDINIDYDIEDKEIKDMKERYMEVKNKAIQEIASKNASDLFKMLPNNITEFYKKIVGEFSKIPVFSKYDMDDLYSKLELTPNYDLYNIINMMTERYKNNENLFREDYKNLKKLCEIIHKNKVDKDKSIKQALLENLAYAIEKISKSI
jgi:hypothetical protein